MRPVQPLSGTARSSTPIELEREPARELAREELADPVYDSEPGLIERAGHWLRELLTAIIEAATGTVSARVALVIVVALVIGAVVIIVARNGPLARQHSSGVDPLFGSARRTAAEHRRLADAAANDADWSIAVIERFRAVAARLEETQVLPARPGRTAGETAREGAHNRPDLTAQLADAAARFDDVRYGGRAAHADDDAAVDALDRALDSSPRRATASTSTAPVPPR